MAIENKILSDITVHMKYVVTAEQKEEKTGKNWLQEIKTCI